METIGVLLLFKAVSGACPWNTGLFESRQPEAGPGMLIILYFLMRSPKPLVVCFLGFWGRDYV